MYFEKLNYNLQLYIASKILNVSKDSLVCTNFIVTNAMENIAREHLLNHKPLSKIFHEKYFWKYCFYTNEHTLDPRPETEELISLILSHDHKNVSLLELGVGTGAIILTLMKEMQLSNAVGIDISPDALDVCKRNSEALNVSPTLKINDWLMGIEEKFDILVSNPPYLLLSEINENKDVLQHDPLLALYGFDDGLYFYKEIAKKQHLFKYIYLEAPPIRHEKIRELFKNHLNVYII